MPMQHRMDWPLALSPRAWTALSPLPKQSRLAPCGSINTMLLCHKHHSVASNNQALVVNCKFFSSSNEKIHSRTIFDISLSLFHPQGRRLTGTVFGDKDCIDQIAIEPLNFMIYIFYINADRVPKSILNGNLKYSTRATGSTRAKTTTMIHSILLYNYI